MDRIIYDTANSPVNITVAASSASATLPGNSAGKNNTYIISCTGNAHFRFGSGAQTAVATDQMIVGTSGPLVVVMPAIADTIAAIQEGSGSLMNIARVMEG